MKKCTSCLAVLPLSSFAKKRNAPDGLQYECRECCAKYAAQWRVKNAEKVKAANLQYARENAEAAKVKAKAWAKANPERKKATNAAYRRENAERIREAQKAYRRANAEKIRAHKKEYAAKNKEKIKAQRIALYYANAESNRAAAKAWAKANPEKRRAQHAARKATKIKATPKWADLEKIQEFYAYAAFLSESTGEPHHVDHIVPLRSKKVCGLHCEFNLQVLPAVENLKKRNNFEPG